MQGQVLPMWVFRAMPDTHASFVIICAYVAGYASQVGVLPMWVSLAHIMWAICARAFVYTLYVCRIHVISQ